MMKITRTEHGIKWDDMQLNCLCEDDQGRVYLSIERGKKKHQIYITKTGKLVSDEVKTT